MEKLNKTGNLIIDEALAIKLIGDYLNELILQQKSNGLLLGLSGGIDSCLLVTIAVKTLGKENVKVSFIYDRDSEKKSETKAKMVADWLDLELDTIDISPVMKHKRVYFPLIMKVVPYSAKFNRFIQHTYQFINRETPFKTSLKVGGDNLERNWLKKIMFNLTIRHIDRGFSERHIYRRQIMEQRAQSENLTFIGAANRSEFEVGWFVKGGIDDLPDRKSTRLNSSHYS